MRQLYQFLMDRFDGFFFFVLIAVYFGLVIFVFASGFFLPWILDLLRH